jgi:hypothetical protein
MSRSMLAALTLVAVAACSSGERRDVATADSLNRDLQLAPVDTTAELNDRAAATPPTPEPAPPAAAPARRPTTPAAKPKPKPAQPKPQPAPPPAAERPSSGENTSAAAVRSLAAGTTIAATTTDEIRSNKNKVGDEVTASVTSDVRDAGGRVIIPAGSTVTLKITAIKESENKSDKTGTLTLMPSSISINGKSYPLAASIDQVESQLVDRGTNAGDVAKVGGGAAAGAVVGRVLGGSSKGAVIGGIIGGAVGAQRANETQDKDIVVPSGARVSLTLTERMTI